jgi:uncharacterized membrane protein SirB2
MKHLTGHVRKEINKHLFDYLILLTGGVLFLLILKVFQGNRTYSFVASLAFCVLYIVWGMYHHYKLRSLHLKNIVEYILIGFTFLFLLKVILAV